jgi:serine/threonine protein kinase
VAGTIIIMELCDRGSLETTVLRKRKLLWQPDGSRDQEAILRLMVDVAAGLMYLHSIGIVHGDVKAGKYHELKGSRKLLCHQHAAAAQPSFTLP